MKSAIIPVLFAGLLSSGVMAAETAAKSAPQGTVTIQEIPMVLVEAKRENAKVIAKADVAPTPRELTYAAR